MLFENAKKYCKSLKLGGFEDWYLPNIVELKSIGNHQKRSPSIDDIFQNVRPGCYWSSTMDPISLEWWEVDFGEYSQSGIIDNGSEEHYGCYVRCARTIKEQK